MLGKTFTESLRSFICSLVDRPEAVRVHIDPLTHEVEIRVHLSDLKKIAIHQHPILSNSKADGLTSQYILKFGCSS